jgi:hypothetical protein
MTWGVALVLAVAAAGVGGCGADLGTVRFQMPTKVYRFTTTRAIWASAPATMPEATCAAAADCCKPLGAVTTDCSAVGFQCDQFLCGMTLALDRWQPIWILREIPDLALLDRGALLSLEVTRVQVRAAEEPRPDAPPATVALLFGPYDAQLATDMRSRTIAEAPEVRLGGEGNTDLVLTPHARTALRALLEKPYEPLSMVAGARLSLPPHAAVPKGEFAVALDIELATKLGL